MARPLLDCPQHWIRTTLEPNPHSSLITHVDSGATPSTTREEYWDGDIPWLTPKEITDHEGIYVSTTERMITFSGLTHSAAKLLPAGTVMLTKRAPVGAVVINALPMATNQGFLNFRCGSLLRPLYLAYWFRVNKAYLDIVANGSTYPELYKSDLFEFEIAIPPIPEQDTILGVISALQYVAQIGTLLEQCVTDSGDMIQLQDLSRRLRTIRDAILPWLFAGTLDTSQVLSVIQEEIPNDRRLNPTSLRGQTMPPSLWS